MVYDTLLGLDAGQTIQPQMADSWTESNDHLTYTFTLRDKLTFSDGLPVTAQDVLASWTRWAETDCERVLSSHRSCRDSVLDRPSLC